MSDPTFAQNVAAFDESTRKMRRGQLSIVLLGPLLFLIVWGINATGLADQLGWSSFFKNFARSFTGGWAIGAIPVLLLTAFELRKQRGSVVSVKDRLIQQKSAKRTREIYFHEIKRVIVFRDAKTQKQSLSIMRGSFHNMAILDQERMDELIELLRERMPDSAEIIESSQRQYSYHLGGTAVWVLAGGASKPYMQRVQRGKAAFRIGEVIIAVLLLIGLVSSLIWTLLDTSNSCNLLNRSVSGCVGFVADTDDGFAFADDGISLILLDAPTP